MIQDIREKYDNTYHRYDIEGGDTVLIYKGYSVLARKTGDGMEFPTAGMLDGDPETFIYLFSVGTRRYFASLKDEDVTLNGYEYTDLRALFGTDSDNTASFAAVTGMQLSNWYRIRKYCGRCGSLNEIRNEERTLVCPRCGLTEYPRISPAVIIGVTDGDSIVLTKYAEGYDKFALVAGFCEIGESFEATIKREVMEEIGLKVKNITYFDSQPWSYSDSMLAGFYCEVDGDRTIKVDGREIGYAGWYKKEDIPERRDGISLTGKMMMHFKYNDVELVRRK